MRIRPPVTASSTRQAQSRSIQRAPRHTPDWYRKPNAFTWAVASAFAAPLLGSLVAPQSAYSQSLPSNGAVTSGAASIIVNGQKMTITNTPGTNINWQSFNIGSGNTVQFVQQSAASMVFNKVTGSTPSTILGNMISNGKVFLINPNGITIGAGAYIDTAGFVASSLGISNANLLAGRLVFDQPGTGNVSNAGTIVTQSGGFVYFVGKNVENSGVIHTPKGEIILAAGNTVEIINPKSPDLRVEITASGNEAVNLGKLVASGGTVGMFAGNIRHSGVIQASSAEVNAQGKIVFKAKQNITLEAGSRTEASGPTAGNVTVQSETGTVVVKGSIEAIGTATPKLEANLPQSQTGITLARENTITVASVTAAAANGVSALLGNVSINATPKTVGASQSAGATTPTTAPTNGSNKGGTVQILGSTVVLDGAATVDASGDAGGGVILAGGDFQGKNPEVQNAKLTFVGQDVMLKANAELTGNGGKVIVWADEATHFVGQIEARGGRNQGNGGFAEVSGKDYLYFNPRGAMDLRAPNGEVGTLLLDPTNVTITGTGGTSANYTATAGVYSDNASNATSVINWTSITSQLSSSNVIVTTSGGAGSAGTITVASASGNINNSGNNLTLLAHSTITVNSGANINITAGAGAVSLLAGWDGVSTASPVLTGATNIAVNGGATITNAAGAINLKAGATGSVTTLGNALTLTGAAVTVNGTINTSKTNAAGGAVNISATGAGSINLGAIVTDGTGQVSDAGQNAGDVTLKTANGNITTLSISAAGSGASGSTNAATGGVGGAVNISAAGGTLSVGSITTLGGAGIDDASPGQGGNGGLVNLLATNLLTIGGDIATRAGKVGTDTSSNTTNSSATSGAINVSSVSGGINLSGLNSDGGNGGAGSGTNRDGSNGGNAASIFVAGAGGINISAVVSASGGQGGAATGTGTDGSGGNANTITISSSGGAVAASNAINASGGAAGTGGSGGPPTIGGGAAISVGGTNVTVVAINASGTTSAGITINEAGTGSQSGVFSGTSLTKTGAGEFVLSQSNLFSSGTTAVAINGGTLTVSADSQLGAAPGGAQAAYISLNGGTLRSTAAALTLNSNRGITLAGAGAIDVSGAANALNYSGVIAGSGGVLNKTGAGTLTLGGVNTYTTATNINQGILSVINNSALGTVAGGTNVAAGATLQFDSSAGALNYALAETVTLTSSGAAAAAINATGTNAVTFAGNIVAAGGSSALAAQINRTGGNLLTLSGNINASASGAESIAISGISTSNITLGAIGNTNPLGSVSINGGTLSLGAITTGNLGGGSGALSITSVGSLVLPTINAAGNATILAGGNITTTAALALNGTTSTIQANGATSDLIITQSVTRTNTGAGTINLGAARNVNISGAAVLVGQSGSTGNTTVNLTSDTDSSAGGGVYVLASAINTSGGAINVSGGTGVAIGAGVNSLSGGPTDEGIKILNSTISAAGGNITLKGQGVVSGVGGAAAVNTAKHGVSISGTSQVITSGTATLTVTGLGGGTGANIGNYGVNIDGGAVVTHSGTGGSITISGLGGTGTGTSQDGVVIGAASSVNTSAASLSIVGTGGSGAAGSNYGVYVGGASTARVNATGGNISISGFGGNGAAGSNFGIYVNGGQINQSGAGGITLLGDASAATAGGVNVGLYINGSGSITHSGASSTVSLTGIGGGAGGNNYGVYVQGDANKVSTGAANLTINGTGGAGPSGLNYGVVVDGASGATGAIIETTGAGLLTLNGSGGAGGAGTAIGVQLVNKGLVQSTGAGSINITGTGAGGSNGIASSGTANVIGNTAMTGDIKLVADSVDLATGLSITTATTGGTRNVYILPKTAATAITVGGAGASSTTYLNDAEIANVSTNVNRLTIGEDATPTVTAGAVTIDAANFGARSVTVSGSGITTTTGAITANGAATLFKATGATSDVTITQSINRNATTVGTLDLQAGRNVNVSGATIGQSAGTGSTTVGILSDSDSSAGGGAYVLASTINTSGGAINISGGTGLAIGAGANSLGGAPTDQGIALLNSTLSAAGGNIALKGQGLGSGGGTTFKHGVSIGGTTQITTTGAGTLTVTGIGGGTGSNDFNYGINISGNGATLSVVNGALTLNGTGGTGSGGNNVGVFIDGVNGATGAIVETTGTGSLSVIGVGGAGNSAGVLLNNKGIVQSSAAGNINITGTGAGTVTGISSTGTGNVVGATNITGNTTLIADSMDLSTGLSVKANTGLLTIKTLTTSREIQLGASAVNTTALGLTDISLANLSGTGGLTIGSLTGTSGNINVTGNGSLSNITAGTVALNTSAGSITFTDGSTLTTATNMTVETTTGSIGFGATGTGALNAAANTVTLKAPAGAITKAGVGTNNVTAGTLNLSASTGIGNANPLLTAASAVTFANTTSGKVQVSNTGGVTFAGTNGGTGNVVLAEATGNLAIGAAGVTSGGNLNLTGGTSGIITQTGALTVTGGLTVNTAANIGVGDVSISTTSPGTALSVAAGSQVAGNLVLNAGGRNVSMSGASVDVAGSATINTSGTINTTNLRAGSVANTNTYLNANAASFDLTQTAIDNAVTGGSVLTINLAPTTNTFSLGPQAGAAVTLTGANSIGGPVTINTKAITYTGTTTQNNSLTQTAPAAFLNFSGVAYTILGSASGSVTLANAGNSGNATFNLTNTQAASLLTAGTLGVSGSATSLTTNSVALNFGNLALTGALNATATGNVTQTASTALTVGGIATFTAGANNITLSQTGNNFATVAIVSAGSANLRDTDGIIVGTSNITGALDLTAGGAVTQTGAGIVVGGTTTITAGNNDITLGTTGNDFNGIAVVSGKNVTIKDSVSGMTVTTGNIAAGGDVNLTANGLLTVTGNITTANQTASATPSGLINLSTTAGSITVNGNLTTGNSTVTSAVAADSATSGAITINAAGAVSGTGAISTGTASVAGNAGGSETATSGSVNITGTSVRLSNVAGLATGNATVTSAAVAGDTATAGSITISATGGQIDNGTSATAMKVTLGTVTAAGGTATPGALTASTTGATGAAGGIYLTSANDLKLASLTTAGGTVSVTTTGTASITGTGTINTTGTGVAGGDVTLTSAAGLVVGNIDARGGVSGNNGLTGGNINLSAVDANLTAGALQTVGGSGSQGDATVGTGGTVTAKLTGATAARTLTLGQITADGGAGSGTVGTIAGTTGGAGGAINITGAGGLLVTLSLAGIDSKGRTGGTGAATFAGGAGGAGGVVNVLSNGGITLAAAINASGGAGGGTGAATNANGGAGGVVNISSTGAALSLTGIDTRGGVVGTGGAGGTAGIGGNINLSGNTGITQTGGTINAGSALNLTAASGNIVQTGGTINAPGTTTITAAPAGNITLDKSNDFGTVTVTNGNVVTLNDTTGIILGAMTSTGNLNVTATGTMLNGNINTTGGAVNLANAGNAMLNTNVSIVTGNTATTAGGVTFGANTINANATNQTLTINASGSAASGNVTIGNVGNNTALGGLNVTGGTISVGTVNTSGGGAAGVGGAVNISALSANNIVVGGITAGGAIAAIGANGGGVTIVAANGTINSAGINTRGGDGSAGNGGVGGAVNVTGTGVVNLNAAVSAAGGNGAGAGNGGAAGAVNLRSSSGALNVSAISALAGTGGTPGAKGAIDLSGATSITQSASTVIAGGALTVNAAGNVTLGTSGAIQNNDVTSFTATATGNVSLTNNGHTGTLALGASTVGGTYYVSNTDSISTAGILALNGTSNTITATGASSDLTIQHALNHNNASASTLDLQAGRHVIFATGGSVNANVAGASLDTVLNSNRSNSGGAISMVSGTSITSNGGLISLLGGSTGTGNATGAGALIEGAGMTGATLTSGGGNITIRGTGIAATSNAMGVSIVANSVVNAGVGSINITGQGGSGSGSRGVFVRSNTLGGTQLTSTAGNITISGTAGAGAGGGANIGAQLGQGGGASGIAVTTAANGTINVTGVGGNDAGGTNAGVGIADNTTITSANGAITISGTGAGTAANNFGVQVLSAGTVISSTGAAAAINLIGQGASGAQGVALGISSTIGGASTTSNILMRSLGGSGIDLNNGLVRTTSNLTLNVIGGGNVDQAAAGTVLASGLRLLNDTAGTMNITGTANNVTTIAGGLVTGSVLNFRDTNGFAIGSVTSSVDGVTANTTSDGLVVGSSATAADAVNLTANGAITQTVLGKLTAGTLTVSNNGVGGTDLSTATGGNLVGNLGASSSTGGVFTLVDASTQDLVLTGTLTATGQNVTLKAQSITDGNTAATRAITAATVNLTGLGGAGVGAIGSGTANGEIDIVATTLNVTTANNNNAFVKSAGGFDIGASGAGVGTGNLTLNAGAAVTQTGALAAAGLELLGAGSFTLTNTGNDVAKIGGAVSGAVKYVDATALAVDTVGGTNGFTGVGNITLNTQTGNLILNQALNAGINTVKLQSAGSVTQLGTGVITAGHLGVNAGTSISLAATNAVAAGGSLAATAGGGNLAFINTNGVKVDTIAADGTIFTAQNGLSAAGNIIVLSAGAGTFTQTVGKNIAATGLELNGAAAYTLDSTGNAITNIAATTGAGAIKFVNGAALTVGTVSATNGITRSGDVLINNQTGDITLSQNIGIGVNTLRLQSVAGKVDQTGGTITAGTLGVNAGTSISLGQSNAVATTVAMKATSGNILFKNANGYDINTVAADGSIFTLADGLNAVAAGTNITLDTTGAVTQTTAKNVLTSATGGLELKGAASYTLTNTTNDVGLIAAATGAGVIKYVDANALTVGTVNTVGITRSGDVLINNQTGDITLTQNIGIAANTLRLESKLGKVDQTGGTITAGTLGVNAGTSISLGQSNAVATTVAMKATSGNILFKNANGYDINTVAADGSIFTLVDGLNAVAAGTNITLDTTGAVTQTTAKNVLTSATGGLELKGAASYTLTNATNNIGTIAGNTTGAVNYRDADLLAVGTVNTTGLTSGNTNITLQAGGALSLNQLVNAGAGNVSLTTTGGAGSTMTQNGTGVITANTLTLNGAGNITLTNTANDVATLVMAGGNSVSYTDATALNISATAAQTGAVAIIATGVADLLTNLTGNGGIAVTGSAITATANSYVTNGGAITLTGPVTLGAGAKTFDTTNATPAAAGANVTFTGTVTGGVGLTVTAGTGGTVDFQGVVGGGTKPTALNVTGNSIKLVATDINGLINLTAQNGGIATLTGAVTSNNNTINLALDDLALTGSINSGGAAVNLTTATAARTITLGGTGGLSVSNAELGAITTGAGGAGLLTIGDAAHSGAIVVAGAVTQTGTNQSLNLNLVNNTGGIAFNGNVTLNVTGTLNVTANAGASAVGAITAGGGTLFADNLNLLSASGTGTAANPVKIGRTATVNAINTTSGHIYLEFSAGNATVGNGNALTNQANGGAVNLNVKNGILTTGMAALTSTNGALTLTSSDAGAGAGITIGTGGLNSKNGTISVYSADNLTVGGIIDSRTTPGVAGGGGNITLVAGVAGVGATGFASNATETTFDTIGTLQLNNQVIAGTYTAAGGGNITLMSTGPINQITGSAGGVQAGTGNSLTALSFNNAAGGGVIDLRNIQALTGNAVGSITIDTRLENAASPPYAASNIFYSAINGVTVTGLGTASEVSLGAQNFIIGAASNLQGTKVILNATGTAGTGTITVNSTLGNANVNSGISGGSLTLNAFDGITLNGSIGTAVTPFDHALKLVAGGGINVNNSIFLPSTRDLSFQANSTLATLNASGGGVFTGTPTGGGVTITAPVTGIRVEARDINIGTAAVTGPPAVAAAPVQFFVLDGSAVVSNNAGDRTTTLKATGILNITTAVGAGQAAYAAAVQNGNFAGATNLAGSVATAGAGGSVGGFNYAPATGDVLIKGGNALGGGTANAGVLIQAGTFKVDVKGNLVFKAGTVNGILGGSANAEVLVSNPNSTVDVGGNLIIAGGNVTGGAGSAYSKFDPLAVSTGRSLAVIGGYGPSTYALLTNSGQIKILVNTASAGVPQPQTFAAPEIGTVQSGLIVAGGSGTGVYNFNTALRQLQYYYVNTLPPGTIGAAPITLSGGSTQIFALNPVGGVLASAGVVQSNVPINPSIDLGAQIDAADRSTIRVIGIDPSKNKNKNNDDGC